MKGASDRNFGYTFAVILLLAGVWPLLRGGHLRPWAAGAGLVFLVVTMVRASALGPLNRVWIRVGALLNRIVSPLISALVFFVAITPIAFFFRWKGKDSLRLKKDEKTESYWVLRQPPGPEPATMADQF